GGVGGSWMGRIFGLALASPGGSQARLRDEGSEEEWQWVRKQFVEVVEKCDGFRVQEGKSLYRMLAECCEKIRENLKEIGTLDPERVARIRERLKTNAASYLADNGFDANRLDQELLYYIEKLEDRKSVV